MRFLNSLIVTLALTVGATITQAGDQDCASTGGCEVECPRCDHVCKFSVDKEDDVKSFYSVDCKPICIPKVVFPWQKPPKCSAHGKAGCGCTSEICGKCKEPECSCVNNGACVKYVRVLKKFEYVCQKCKYTWKAVPGCRSCTTGTCSTDLTPTPSAKSEESTATIPLPDLRLR